MHPLKYDDTRFAQVVGKARAVVTAKAHYKPKRLVIVEGSLGIAKHDTLFVPVPESIPVLDPDGKPIKPSKGSKFWISVETFDPYHILLEAEHLPLA